MSNWALEVISQLVRATFAGDTPPAEKVYLVMLDLSRKLHFTDSTIASHMALYACGDAGGFPRRPWPCRRSTIRNTASARNLERGFAELALDLEMGDDRTIA